MLKRAHNVFMIVANFFSNNLEPKHVSVKWFAVDDMNGVAMIMKLKQLFNKFSLTKKIVANVKNEGFNL